MNTANAKASLAFIPALTLGIMCNALVCLAVWMCFSARTTIDRILTIVPPIFGIRGGRFRTQHCQRLLHSDGPVHQGRSAGRFLGGPVGRTPADFPELTWGNFLLGNLLPVTINIIGGSIMVAAVYWFVYLRNRKS